MPRIKSVTLYIVKDFNWLQGTKPKVNQFNVKLRHGPVMTPGELHYTDNGGIITLAEDDQGIAPGQFAVFMTVGVLWFSIDL